MSGPARNRRAYDDVLGHVAARRRRRRAIARRHGRRSVAATALIVIAIGFAAVVASGGVGATLYVSDVLKGYDLKTLKPHYPGVTTRIFDRNGNLLAPIPSIENRTPVPSSEISPLLKTATVDVEDKRFYQHGGVDYQGVLRAAYEDVTAGGVVQGASTIEQQLVRNVYLTDEQSLTRKLREAYLATQMADQWSKDKILTTYLNTIPYGPVTYGCEAAAAAFFNTHCSSLSLGQAALIAGLPQSPTEYNPRLHPAAAKARRNQVLAAMYAAGHISLNQFNAATARGLGLKKPTKSTTDPPALLRRVRAAAPEAQVRQVRGEARRPPGEDHPRPGDPERCARGDRQHDELHECPGGRHGGDRPAHGRDPGDAVVDRLHAEQVQPGRRRQAPGRIDVQDVRAPGGDGRLRHRPVHDAVRDVPARELPARPGRHGPERAVDGEQRGDDAARPCCRWTQPSSSR